MELSARHASGARLIATRNTPYSETCAAFNFISNVAVLYDFKRITRALPYRIHLVPKPCRRTHRILPIGEMCTSKHGLLRYGVREIRQESGSIFITMQREGRPTRFYRRAHHVSKSYSKPCARLRIPNRRHRIHQTAFSVFVPRVSPYSKSSRRLRHFEHRAVSHRIHLIARIPNPIFMQREGRPTRFYHRAPYSHRESSHRVSKTVFAVFQISTRAVFQTVIRILVRIMQREGPSNSVLSPSTNAPYSPNRIPGASGISNTVPFHTVLI